MRIKELFENTIVSPNGIGAVPDNRQVDYLGVKVMMKPSMFLRVASPLKPEQGWETADYLADQLQKGKSLGNPFLEVIVPTDEVKGDGTWQVKGHEGRHRMMAIYSLHGDVPVEVHLFFAFGYRGRDFEPSWVGIKDVRSQRGSVVVRNAIERFIK